ncbi:MAG: glycosyl hydrolase family 38 [Bacteroidota bacterium]
MMKNKMLFCLLSLVFLRLATVMGQNLNPIGKNEDIIQGFGKKVTGLDFTYHSSLPDIEQALLVRALDGKQDMVWESEQVPDQPRGKFINVVWLGAVGANLGNVQMDLAVNGQQLFSFFTERRKAWNYDLPDGSRLSFRATLVDGPGDLFGFFFLRLPVDKVTPGKPVRLAVTASKRNSQAWYMTFQSSIPTGLTFKSYPALKKVSGSLVQPVAVQVIWFGQPDKATLKINSRLARTFNLDFGVNQFTIHIPAVEQPTRYTFLLETKGLTQKEIIVLEPVRHWQVNFVQHTHTDIGYTRPQTEILAEHVRYIDYALDYCDATDSFPDEARFRWTCENSYAVEQYLKIRPEEQIQRLKERIREGRIEVTGMIFNFDETPDEQTYAASLDPVRLFLREGIPVTTAMQDDVNGFGWCLIDYFKPLGIRFVNMGINDSRALLPFDKPTAFWWESPSGNRVLAYRAEHYMIGNTHLGIHSQNFENFENSLMSYLDELAGKGYSYDLIPLQHSGYQTDNSPPSTLACDMVRQWNEKYEWPKLKTATISEFFEILESDHSMEIPVYRAAWPDWWTDGYATAAREAAAVRQAKAEIIANQGVLSIASLAGVSISEEIPDRIKEANRALHFYDEHTFGFAESVTAPLSESTLDQRGMKESYAWEASRRIRTLGEETMGFIQTLISRDPACPTLAIINTLNWPRSGFTEVYIDHQILPAGKSFRITSPDGNAVPVQALAHRSDGTYWGIWVSEIPPMGYKTYRIEVDPESDVRPAPASQNGIKEIENHYYKGVIDTATGTLSHLFDKELGLELVDSSAPWKMGQFVHEVLGNRSQMESRTLKDYSRYPLDSVWFDAYEEGPVWNTVRFKGESGATVAPAGFVVEMRMFNTCKRIDFVYRIRKKLESDPESIYISFPFLLPGGKIFCDVQGGILEAGVNQIPGSATDWNSVQNFASVRNSSAQILLASDRIPLMQFGGINTGRYQYGAKPATTHIYGWPMNNYWTTNFNADQRGELTFTYTLSSAADTSNLFATRFGWGNRIPLLARVLPPGRSNGQEPVASFLNIEPGNLLLINAKPEPTKHAVILQVREVAGRRAEIKAKNERRKNKEFELREVDVIGRPVGDGSEPVIFKPFESKFIQVKIHEQ